LVAAVARDNQERELMDRTFVVLKAAAALGILAIYLRWRYRLASSEQLISGINQLSEWMGSNRARVLRYTRAAQAVAGLLLLLFGYYIGKEHFHLIREGIRTQGTIVDYQQESLPNGGGVRWDFASMPIIKFQAGDRIVQFKDWMGSKAELRNVQIMVLYDPVDPSVAMIDRPVWNWIPWAPTFGVGLFLVLVAIKGWFGSQRQCNPP
jgi:hypothetical protein